MKKKEFEEIKNELVDGLDVVVRYFTYNKNHYVDILGTISHIYGFIRESIYGNYYTFTIKYDSIINYAGDFNENTYPNLETFFLKDDEYLHIHSNEVLFIRKACLRSYKLNKIKENIT